MRIYPVPEIFQVPDVFYYPEDNWPDFEYWFMKNISEEDLMYQGRMYLPILFTSYFKRNEYGKNKEPIDTLQNFVDTLPADKKYFCVVQYDDGVLINWKGKDVKVFSMSGNGDIPIPLVCQPHSFEFPDFKKDILCSFVGRITDPSRKLMMEWGQYKNDLYFTDSRHTLFEYCRILARSKFVFCPRGYGTSSFRIAESLQYGCMPIQFCKDGDAVYKNRHGGVIDYIKLDKCDLDYLYSYMTENKDQSWSIEMEQDFKENYSFSGVKKIILQSLWDLL